LLFCYYLIELNAHTSEHLLVGNNPLLVEQLHVNNNTVAMNIIIAKYITFFIVVCRHIGVNLQYKHKKKTLSSLSKRCRLNQLRLRLPTSG
jgi:hypothetical protein